MPRLNASIKDVRKTKKRTLRNITVRTQVKRAVKAAVKAIENKKDAAALISKACSAIDKAVKNGVFHKNTGARKKSKLVKKLNKSKK